MQAESNKTEKADPLNRSIHEANGVQHTQRMELKICSNIGVELKRHT
jgi:hypothetical protein